MARSSMSRLGSVLRRTLTRTSSPAVSDADLTRALGVYAGMVDHVLTRPERWLGVDPDPTGRSGRGRRVLAAVRSRLIGRRNPTSPTWGQVPVRKRVRWWLRRISLSAGTAAAAPRVAGVLADRLPLQDALGAAASGLAVCAVARENGVTDPADWVPLLARVVFDRDVGPVGGQEIPAETTSAVALDAPTELSEPPSTTGGVERAGRTVWHLAQVFLELGSLFDRRPRGGLLARIVGKFPGVGVAGGWLDERGGIRKAARQTARLLASPR